MPIDPGPHELDTMHFILGPDGKERTARLDRPATCVVVPPGD